jgi:outer membrane protein TolC
MSLLLSGILFFFLVASLAYGDTGHGLTLEEAQNTALQKSPTLQFAEGRKDEFEAKTITSFASFLPTVKASGYKYFDQKYQILNTNLNGTPIAFQLVQPRSFARVSLGLPLFNGFRNWNQYRSASAMESSAAKSHDWEGFVLKRNIREAFYRALAAKELAIVSQENIKTLEDHLGHIQARKRGGLTTSYDVLRVEVQLDEARTQKIEADDRVVYARDELSRLMGVPFDQRELSGSLPEPSSAINVSVLNSDDIDRKDLEAIKLASEAARYTKNSENLWMIPEIGFMADYDWYNNTNYSWQRSDRYRNAYGVGLYVNWNLFDGGASIGKAKESVARLVQAQAKTRMEEQKIPMSIEMLKRRYRYGIALFKTAITDIKKSEESVRQAIEGTKQGVRTVSEQLDSQLDLFRSKATKVNAQLLTAEALINLELTTGKDLSHE